MQLDSDERILCKAFPSVVVVGFGIFGFLFMGGLSYLLISKMDIFEHFSLESIQQGNYNLTDDILFSSCLLVFGGFSLASLFMVINVKKITLTNKRLIIKKPVLLCTKTFKTDEIQSISTKNTHVNNRNTGNLYSGEKTTILLSSKKKITYQSIELNNYYVLNDYIKKVLQYPKHEPCRIKPDVYVSEWIYIKVLNRLLGTKIYVILLFVALLTIGIIYSLVTR